MCVIAFSCSEFVKVPNSTGDIVLHEMFWASLHLGHGAPIIDGTPAVHGSLWIGDKVSSRFGASISRLRRPVSTTFSVVDTSVPQFAWSGTPPVRDGIVSTSYAKRTTDPV
jgi:hypothetical protein